MPSMMTKTAMESGSTPLTISFPTLSSIPLMLSLSIVLFSLYMQTQMAISNPFEVSPSFSGRYLRKEIRLSALSQQVLSKVALGLRMGNARGSQALSDMPLILRAIISPCGSSLLEIVLSTLFVLSKSSMGFRKILWTMSPQLILFSTICFNQLIWFPQTELLFRSICLTKLMEFSDSLNIILNQRWPISKKDHRESIQNNYISLRPLISFKISIFFRDCQCYLYVIIFLKILRMQLPGLKNTITPRRLQGLTKQAQHLSKGGRKSASIQCGVLFLCKYANINHLFFLMKGYLSLQFLQSRPCPSQSKKSSSPCSMSLVAQKATFILPSVSTFFEKRFYSPPSAWLMKRDGFPMKRASIVPSGDPKLQKVLSTLRLSLSKSMLFSMISPVQIISISSFRTASPANRPKPASAIVDRPTLTLLNSLLRMGWLRQVFLISSPKQLLQMSGSHSTLSLKQEHFSVRQSNFLHPHPRLRIGQLLPHKH